MTNRSDIPFEERAANRGKRSVPKELHRSRSCGPCGGHSIADVPPREVGADLGGHSERSKYVKIARIPEAGPGQRNVDPSDAINFKAPLDKLFGSITPSDLHYERSHSGAPDLDPTKHRLLVHGMVRMPLVFNVEDLKAMPSISRVVFIECTGNGWENWKRVDENLSVQNTHGLVSTNEWTGVPLKFLIDLVGKDHNSTWMLAEGGDAAGVARSIPLTDEILEEAFVTYGRNGEPLRPAHGFPMRLIMPGLEGNLHIKWLRRLKFGDQPWMTRWETARYTQLLANGKASQFQLRMDQFSDHIAVRNDGDQVTSGSPGSPGAVTARSRGLRFRPMAPGIERKRDWIYRPCRRRKRLSDGLVLGRHATRIVSRSTDDKGNVQPDRKSFIDAMGTNALFHYNAWQTWRVDETGRVRNVLD